MEKDNLMIIFLAADIYPQTMRRSIGVREAEPPRRLRQSQEFQGVGFFFFTGGGHERYHQVKVTAIVCILIVMHCAQLGPL